MKKKKNYNVPSENNVKRNGGKRFGTFFFFSICVSLLGEPTEHEGRLFVAIITNISANCCRTGD